MKKIIVGIDFSGASRAALAYAGQLRLAQPEAVSLIAVHVAMPLPVNEVIGEAVMEETRKRHAAATLQRLQKFTTPYPNDARLTERGLDNVQCILRFGSEVAVLRNLMEELEADVLLVGSKERYNLWTQLFGSLTSALLRRFSYPLLIVPEKYHYHQLNSLVLALAPDQLSQAEDCLGHPILNSFPVKERHIVSVDTRVSEQDKFREENLPVDVKGVQQTQLVRDTNIISGLDYYLDKYSIELLVLAPEPKPFYELLFSGSVSKQLAYNTDIPLLVLL